MHRPPDLRSRAQGISRLFPQPRVWGLEKRLEASDQQGGVPVPLQP